jgi:ribose 5-phosphate isomerase
MAIDSIPGVVENGLFLNTAYEVLVCDGKGSVTRMSESVAGRGDNREIRVL